jgi:hypothetical protein
VAQVRRRRYEPGCAHVRPVQAHDPGTEDGPGQLRTARGHAPDGRGGVVVSWTPHDLLSLAWDRGNEYHAAHDVMNGALAQVLDALGYQLWPFGLGGAWIVTGRRPGWEGGQ